MRRNREMRVKVIAGSVAIAILVSSCSTWLGRARFQADEDLPDADDDHMTMRVAYRPAPLPVYYRIAQVAYGPHTSFAVCADASCPKVTPKTLMPSDTDGPNNTAAVVAPVPIDPPDRAALSGQDAWRSRPVATNGVATIYVPPAGDVQGIELPTPPLPRTQMENPPATHQAIEQATLPPNSATQMPVETGAVGQLASTPPELGQPVTESRLGEASAPKQIFPAEPNKQTAASAVPSPAPAIERTERRTISFVARSLDLDDSGRAELTRLLPLAKDARRIVITGHSAIDRQSALARALVVRDWLVAQAPETGDTIAINAAETRRYRRVDIRFTLSDADTPSSAAAQQLRQPSAQTMVSAGAAFTREGAQ